jgi:hypothetical protein
VCVCVCVCVQKIKNRNSTADVGGCLCFSLCVGSARAYVRTIYGHVLVISLPKMPHIHRIYTVLANPSYAFMQGLVLRKEAHSGRQTDGHPKSHNYNTLAHMIPKCIGAYSACAAIDNRSIFVISSLERV